MNKNDDNPIFTQMNIVQMILDREGNFKALNPAAEQFFGKSTRELLGLSFTTVLDPFSREKGLLMIEKTLKEGGVNEWELDHLQADGPPVLLGYSTGILRNAAGDIDGLGVIGFNLTHNLQLMTQLAQVNQALEGALLTLEKTHADLKTAEAQLVQSEKMRTLGQLVAGIAHEINNPSAFVANNLAHLAKLVPALHELFNTYASLKPLAGARQLKAIETAETAAGLDDLWQDLSDLTHESMDGMERIRKIIFSLRTFSRLDEGQNKYADINEGLRSTLLLIRPSCKNRIRIIESYAELPQIPCFPGELNQVFLNLLTNAVQAIKEEGTIEVKTTRGAEKITLSIRDSGCGMELSTLERLGEPFFTSKPVGMGVGLGLSISYGIIQRHHGTIRFESELNHGTTVFVELPMQ
jgi:two-component system, NtrC family, sensor kinase